MRILGIVAAAWFGACAPLRLPTAGESLYYDAFGGLRRAGTNGAWSGDDAAKTRAEWRSKLEGARADGWFESIESGDEGFGWLRANGFKRGPYASITWWFGPQPGSPEGERFPSGERGYYVAFAEIREKGTDARGDARLLSGRLRGVESGLGRFDGRLTLPDGRSYNAFRSADGARETLFVVEGGRLAGLVSLSGRDDLVAALGVVHTSPDALLAEAREKASAGPEAVATLLDGAGLERDARFEDPPEFLDRLRGLVASEESSLESTVASLSSSVARALEVKGTLDLLEAVTQARSAIARLEGCCAGRFVEPLVDARERLEALAGTLESRAATREGQGRHLGAAIDWLAVHRARGGGPLLLEPSHHISGDGDSAGSRALRCFARALVATSVAARRVEEGSVEWVPHASPDASRRPAWSRLVALDASDDLSGALEREGGFIEVEVGPVVDDVQVSYGERFRDALVRRPQLADNPRFAAWKKDVELQEAIIQGALYDQQVYGGWSGSRTVKEERRVDANTVEQSEKRVSSGSWLAGDMAAEAAGARSREEKARLRLAELTANPEPERVPTPVVSRQYTLVKEQVVKGGLSRTVRWRIGDRSGALSFAEDLAAVRDRTEAEPAIGQLLYDGWASDAELRERKERARAALREKERKALEQRLVAERKSRVASWLASLSGVRSGERDEERALAGQLLFDLALVEAGR